MQFDHPLRLREQRLRRQHLAPLIVGTTLVTAKLEEQIGRVRHCIAIRAAQKVVDRPATELPLQVQARHLERREAPGERGFRQCARRHFELRPYRSGQPAAHRRRHAGQIVHVHTGQLRRDPGKVGERGPVAVGLVDFNQAGRGFDLDDASCRVGLVHTGDVQHGWIAERDGRDPHFLDKHRDLLDRTQRIILR